MKVPDNALYHPVDFYVQSVRSPRTMASRPIPGRTSAACSVGLSEPRLAGTTVLSVLWLIAVGQRDLQRPTENTPKTI